MITTNTNFDAYHDLDHKQPMYVVIFDGSSYNYCNHPPKNPLGGRTNRPYLANISGLERNIYPNEGRASIGGVRLEIVDVDNNLTTEIGADSYQFQRKETVIKAGYVGMNETDMVTVFTGYVTGLSLTKKGTAYSLQVTDASKYLQRDIFRDATDAAPVTISGNPIDILLKILTSTGAGTNGAYDVYDAVNGVGIDQTLVDITAIEATRDDYFPGTTHYMSFTIKERIPAYEFLEDEIYKVLNLYPIINGSGKLNVVPFKPPIGPVSSDHKIEDKHIVGMPKVDANFKDLVNECKFEYDWDSTDEEFDTTEYFIDSASMTNRGPGKRTLSVSSKGLNAAYNSDAIASRRKTVIFNRYATPPLKIKVTTLFTKWILEPGDIVEFTHSNLPNFQDGTIGFSAERFEIQSVSVDWKRGRVTFTLLGTGFDIKNYSLISKNSVVVSSSDQSSCRVAPTDAKYYQSFINGGFTLRNSLSVSRSTNVVLTSATTALGIMVFGTNFTNQPAAGDVILFGNWVSDSVLSADQRNSYGWISDASTTLGSDGTTGKFILP